MAKKEQSYQELRQQLDVVLAGLQNEDTDIDEAMTLHKEGQALYKQLDVYLAKIAKDADLQDSNE